MSNCFRHAWYKRIAGMLLTRITIFIISGFHWIVILSFSFRWVLMNFYYVSIFVCWILCWNCFSCFFFLWKGKAAFQVLFQDKLSFSCWIWKINKLLTFPIVLPCEKKPSCTNVKMCLYHPAFPASGISSVVWSIPDKRGRKKLVALMLLN